MPPARHLTFSECLVSQPVQERDAPLEGNSTPTNTSVHDVVGGGATRHIEEMLDLLSEPRASSEPRVISTGIHQNYLDLSFHDMIYLISSITNQINITC